MPDVQVSLKKAWGTGANCMFEKAKEENTPFFDNSSRKTSVVSTMLSYGMCLEKMGIPQSERHM